MSIEYTRTCQNSFTCIITNYKIKLILLKTGDCEPNEPDPDLIALLEEEEEVSKPDLDDAKIEEEVSDKGTEGKLGKYDIVS